MAPSYEECKQFEESASYAWRQTLQEYFKQQKIILIECYERNYNIQKDHWDKLIIFRGSESPKRIELKTISEKYYSWFLENEAIAIETIGNTTKYRETGDLGSSIFNTNAEYWGYGFYVPSINPNIIIYPLIFFRQELANYLKPNVQKYRTWKTNTNKLYNTIGIYVPLYEIEKFRVK